MPLPTKAQCAVITAASTQHLLVDAGAGSGKTTTVVQTVCHQLGIPVLGHDGKPLKPVASPLTLDQVAAITFTNQAAADLKRKLRAALRSAGRAELASDVDAARIGTIHGFCGDLMRDHALRARLRPGHRVLSDGEARVLVAECARTELHAAIGARDVEGLDALLVLRRLKDITEWVTRAAGDSDRLERWAARADVDGLRDHERALLEIARRASARRNAHLESEGLIDFDRMLVAARDLLRDTDVRRAVQRRLRLLVVDEFQDVDPVQRDIAELLGGISFAEHEDPAPTRIILVGDPKQSIYRFRRADVTLWNEMARKFRDDDFPGTVLPLSENFRSKAAILGFVDHTIGAMLDTPLDIEARRSFEVDYTPLKPAAPNHGGDRAVEVLLVPAAPDGKPMNANAVRELDSAGVAQRISELHAEGRAYGDMAILLAAWSDVEMYEGALRLAGIPVYVQRGEGFWSRREVLDCVLALRAIRDPGDDIAVVGFLKSPFVGVRDETLMALARARGDSTLSGAITSVPHERELLARADRLLRTFGALRDRLDTAELLRRLLAESGYMAVAALEDDGPQRVANLRKLIRLAGVSSDQSLGEFLREVQDSRDREDKVALEPLYRERGDVVTITSIHGAKGLEWPVVFWSDLVRGAQGEKGPICTGRDTFSISIEAGSKDARHDALQYSVAQEGIAETLRLWYVAATRAKERLILTGLPLGERRKSATSPAQRILAALTGDGDSDDDVLGEHAMPGAAESPRAVAIVDASVEEIAYESATGETYHAVVRVLGDAFVPLAEVQETVLVLPVRPAVVPAVAGAARLSASQLMSFAHDPAQWLRDYVERFPFHVAGGGGDARAGGIGRGAMRAIVAGQVVHDVLERVGNDDVDIGALIEDAIGEWDEEAPGRESDAGVALRAALRARVDAALGSPVWKEIAGAKDARRELWFTRILADGTVIQGALDLAAPTGAGGSEGVRILDVKTGSAGAEELAERYEVQAAVYMDAVRSITGRGDVSFALLSLPSGAVVEISPTTNVGALVQRLRTLPRAGAQGISQAC